MKKILKMSSKFDVRDFVGPRVPVNGRTVTGVRSDFHDGVILYVR